MALKRNLPEFCHSTRKRGRGRGRRRELAEALSRRLSAVSSLAAVELGGVLRPVSAVEREGHLVLAAGVGPGGLVVGVPEVD